MKERVILVMMLCMMLYVLPEAIAGEYVGSSSCGECHEEEYQRFTKYSKKAKSWHSIEVMASDLTQGELKKCFECHTTGYGKGGFINHDATPQLSDVGCETCHGPGGTHAQNGDPELIKRTPTISDCQKCHNAERVEDFKFKPLIHSGAH